MEALHGNSLVARPPIHTASFEKWNPDRHDEIFLYLEGDDTQPQRENYRYKLTVVDRKETTAAAAAAPPANNNGTFSYATAVFLIPAGRESEYMFQSHGGGLVAIAKSAGTARLIAVTFGRAPHTFVSQAAVQEELTYVVQILAARQELMPRQSTATTTTIVNTASIPFLALAGIGDRNVLASGTSAVSGRYLVEQCVVEEQQQVRRLYFLDGNPFVIQSEVALTKEKKSGANSNSEDDSVVMVDKSVTAFEYHKSLTAGILALLLPECTASASGMLIGLGGGGLVNLWHHLQLTAWKVTAVELDPTVVEIASEHFGLDCQRLNVLIGDGLAVHCYNGTTHAAEKLSKAGVESSDGSSGMSETKNGSAQLGFEAESLDFIVIDVDSKDTGRGMSCPPAAFVESAYLQTLLSLLRPNTGVLAINVSARDPLLFQSACQTVKTVFPSVFLSKRQYRDKDNNRDDGDDDEEDDLNVVVFATRNPDGFLPPLRAMTDCVTQRIQESQGKDGLDEILVSDLCACLEDFVVFDESGTSQTNSGAKKKTGNKRRNNKRGNNKRR